MPDQQATDSDALPAGARGSHTQSRPVPALTQFASPDLIEQFAYEGRSPADDPQWRVSGAPTQADYGFWAPRWCGLTCLRMALLARDGHAPTLWELLNRALAYGVYSLQPDGTVGGLYYAPFADYAADRTRHRPAHLTYARVRVSRFCWSFDRFGRIVNTRRFARSSPPRGTRSSPRGAAARLWGE